MVSARLPEFWGAHQRTSLEKAADQTDKNWLGVLPVTFEERSSPSLSHDAELVRQCLQGDQKHGFRLLYSRYQGQVRSTLYRLCGPSHLDDLVQEVFLRAWKGLPKFRQSAKFSTWLYRITCNVAADRRRQCTKPNQFSLSLESLSVSEDTSDLMDLHYRDLVYRGLKQLSWEHRAVLVLHDLQDLPQKEVAEILQVPLGTVKSRLFHGRAGMRQFLAQEGVQL